MASWISACCAVRNSYRSLTVSYSSMAPTLTSPSLLHPAFDLTVLLDRSGHDEVFGLEFHGLDIGDLEVFPELFLLGSQAVYRSWPCASRPRTSGSAAPWSSRQRPPSPVFSEMSSPPSVLLLSGDLIEIIDAICRFLSFSMDHGIHIGVTGGQILVFSSSSFALCAALGISASICSRSSALPRMRPVPPRGMRAPRRRSRRSWPS